MADNSQRTEKPTPRRLEKARKDKADKGLSAHRLEKGEDDN